MQSEGRRVKDKDGRKKARVIGVLTKRPLKETFGVNPGFLLIAFRFLHSPVPSAIFILYPSDSCLLTPVFCFLPR